MSNVNLHTYADEGRLVDTDIVGFLRKKLDKGDKLDFTDIVEVADAVLDALFDGWSPEQAADAIAELSPAADAALAAWQTARAARSRRPRRPRARPRCESPRPTVPPSVLERDPSGDERFTPTRLVRRLQEALRGYIESAYPLNDPTLVRARRRLLEEEAGGHLLAQEPYIETTTRYATLEGDLRRPRPHAGARAASSRSSPRPPRPRARRRTRARCCSPRCTCIRSARSTSSSSSGSDIVVATGTGSGKTECFLVPMLGSLYDEAVRSPEVVRAARRARADPLPDERAGERSARAPASACSATRRSPTRSRSSGRIALPALRHVHRAHAVPGPAHASRDGERVEPLLDYYLGMSPEVEAAPAAPRPLSRQGPRRRSTRKNEERRRTYQSGKRAGQEYTDHNWERRLHTGAERPRASDAPRDGPRRRKPPGHAPDVLVTNYSMLEYMLMRPFERPIFEETKRWLDQDGTQLLLVLDEAHMYRGAKGAEVAFLIRRLRARLGIHDRPDKLRVIATSASLGEGAAAVEDVKRFAADLTGKQPGELRGHHRHARGSDARQPGAEGRRRHAGLARSRRHQRGARRPGRCAQKLAPLFGSTSANLQRRRRTRCSRDLHAALEGPAVGEPAGEGGGRAGRGTRRPRAARVPRAPAKRAAHSKRCSRLATLAAQQGRRAGPRADARARHVPGLHGLYACVNPRAQGGRASPESPPCSASSSRRRRRGVRCVRLPRLRDRVVPELRQPVPARVLARRVARPTLDSSGARPKAPLPARAASERAALHRPHRRDAGPPAHRLPRHRRTASPTTRCASLASGSMATASARPRSTAARCASRRRRRRAASTTSGRAASNRSPRSSRRSSPSSRRRRSTRDCRTTAARCSCSATGGRRRRAWRPRSNTATPAICSGRSSRSPPTNSRQEQDPSAMQYLYPGRRAGLRAIAASTCFRRPTRSSSTTTSGR